ncbi:hypothetical protein R7G67_27385, partial [Klebsiella pneumoniae]|nr:hypothetical protein [Klebsiella pneumoniae]MDW1309175.1 hypothetical protein [Klebsiella pneumoniae]
VAPGEWIDAVPLAGSFVVNIGELLELATNGYLRATVQGVGAHKDSGFLSFLLQDEQKGLQVEVAPGEWIDAVP